MPAELCPRCGTARTAAGCACSSDPSSAETAVLPHVEGPPLVRPYVAAAPVEQPGPGPDPFATRLTPPVGIPPLAPPPPPAQPPAVPPHITPLQVTPPPAAVQLGPVPPAAAQTTVLPPIPAQAPGPVTGPGPVPGAEARTQLIPPQPQQPYAPPQQPVGDPESWEPGPEPAADLGMFAFREEAAPAPGSRAERRAEQQQAAGRRRLVIAGAMVGLAAVGAGLALALAPATPDRADKALPAPTDSGVPYPGPTTPTVDSSSGSPSPATSSAKPSSKPPTTKAPTTPTTVPAAPASPSAAGSTSSKPSASPSPSASPRDLRRGDRGDDVTAMQTQLVNAMWWYGADLITGIFDKKTEQALRNFQTMVGVHGEDGWYGPKTRTALANYA